MDKLKIKDLDFIKTVSPELEGTILMMFAMSVDEIYEGLQGPAEKVNSFLADIDEAKRLQLIDFYTSVLEVFTEKEMYEECVRIMYILESVKLLQV